MDWFSFTGAAVEVGACACGSRGLPEGKATTGLAGLAPFDPAEGVLEEPAMAAQPDLGAGAALVVDLGGALPIREGSSSNRPRGLDDGAG